MKKNKKKLLYLLLTLVVIVAAIFSTKAYLRESQISNYLNWFDETYQNRLIESEQGKVIAYVNDTPIYSKDLMLYAMQKSIDTNYFQQIGLDESLESAEVLQPAFDDVWKDTFYCVWADKAGLNYEEESIQEWFNQVMETQSKSKTPNISAKATVQIRYKRDFKRSWDGSCAHKLLDEKFYPNFTNDPIEISQYSQKLFLNEVSKYNFVILEAAPDCLKTDEYLSRLREAYGMNITLS